MTQDELLRLGIGFVGIWLAICVTSWLHIRAQTSAGEKKKWFERYTMLMGAFIAGAGGAVLISRGIVAGAFIMLAIIAALTFFKIRFSYFCEMCGKMSSTRPWQAKDLNCPHCGSRLR